VEVTCPVYNNDSDMKRENRRQNAILEVMEPRHGGRKSKIVREPTLGSVVGYIIRG